VVVVEVVDCRIWVGYKEPAFVEDSSTRVFVVDLFVVVGCMRLEEVVTMALVEALALDRQGAAVVY
jgi:hypothetical protein